MEDHLEAFVSDEALVIRAVAVCHQEKMLQSSDWSAASGDS